MKSFYRTIILTSLLIAFIFPLAVEGFADESNPVSSHLLGTWEKVFSNGDKISLTFKSGGSLEVSYPKNNQGPQLAMWRMKGDTALLFTSDAGIAGRLGSDGRLMILGPQFGKPLFDLILTKRG